MPAKKKLVKKATTKKVAKKAAPKKKAPKKAKVTPKAAKKAPAKKTPKKLAATPQLAWDPNVPREVEAARDVFALFSKRRQEAFRVKADGTKGDLMPKFDGAAGAMLFRPVPSRYDRISA